MTLHHWQQHWRAQLPADSADLDLRLIAEHTTGLTPTAQRLRPDHPLDAATRHALDALAARRAQGEPLAYILGHQPFYDLDLRVTPATLIPRPDTETLVDAALARLPQDCSATVLDLGTGSGAIALAIGKHRPRATIIASDLSAEALAVARENACHNRIPNVHFVQTSWLAAFADHCADLIASNPPYIADGDPHLAALAHEPQTALTAGHDGLDDIRTLLRDAPRVLRPGGWLLFEHGYDQRDAIAALINHDDWASADFAKDYGGNWRICLLKSKK